MEINQNENHAQHHILPLWVYLSVAGALFVLTVVTVAASYVDFNAITGLSSLNLIVAMLIATIKAGLVAAIFMHLVFDHKIYVLVLGSGLGILGIFIILTLFDTETRGVFDERVQRPTNPQVEYRAPSSTHDTGSAEH